MITNITKATEILKEHSQKKELAFILGNGINRYRSANSNISWNKMLLDVWNAISIKTLSDIDKGITMTEFYNIMEFEADAKEVRNKTVEIVKSWIPSAYEEKLKKRLIEINCPVLTTNFDSNIEKGLTRYTMDFKAGFSDFYPWNVYFSNRELADPLDGFGVWHINGMVDYPRSLRLSLSEYINLTTRARNYIHKGDAIDNFDKKNITKWNGYHTWLHLIFNSNLIIIGLALDEQETFLRWLLIERAKYFKKFKDRKKKGWYVSCQKETISQGKKMFLDYLGFEIINLPDYQFIYENLLQI